MKTFDINQRYRIRHADGSLTMVFPEHGEKGRAHHFTAEEVAAIEAREAREADFFAQLKECSESRELRDAQRRKAKFIAKLKRRRRIQRGRDFMAEVRRGFAKLEASFVDIEERTDA